MLQLFRRARFLHAPALWAVGVHVGAQEMAQHNRSRWPCATPLEQMVSESDRIIARAFDDLVDGMALQLLFRARCAPATCSERASNFILRQGL
jgi:hypothetical protein